MSKSKAIICSFCGKGILVPLEMIGSRAKCPKCTKTLMLLPNKEQNICEQLKSKWYYSKTKMLVMKEEHGPVDDDRLLTLIDRGSIGANEELRSPQLTNNSWVSVGQVNLAALRDRVAQRSAEEKRQQAIASRAARVAQGNQESLRRLIKEAIADGVITSDEKDEITRASKLLKISREEVIKMLASECGQIIKEIVDEVTDDGILDPDEEEKIKKFTTSFKAFANLTEQQKQRLVLCRHAYVLNSRPVKDFDVIDSDYNLDAREECYIEAEMEWFDVVRAKRKVGVPIGDGAFLKSIASGKCYVTSKHVVLVSSYDSKKVRNSTISKVSFFSDGVYLNRSSGKSVFLRFLQDDFSRWEFALTALRIISDAPVQGHLGESPLINEDANEAESEFNFVDVTGEPRFTFRVVGSHVDLRGYHIAQLNVGDKIVIQREPDNDYDENAVLVLNAEQQELGYLKREVAEWFSKIMDSGSQFSCNVFKIYNDETLIIGVYE